MTYMSEQLYALLTRATSLLHDVHRVHHQNISWLCILLA